MAQETYPVYGPLVSKVVSPVCHCANRTAKIRIRLRHPDKVTVTILDASRDKVATVASGVHLPARRPDHFVWNGLTDAGTPAPDGVYRSQAFPGLWLDPAALIRGDLLKVLHVLQEGVATPEHAAFVARLKTQFKG